MVDEEDRQLAQRDLFDRLELIESGLAFTDNEEILQEIHSLEEMAAQAGFHVLARQAAALAQGLHCTPAALPADFLDRMRDSLERDGADGAPQPQGSAPSPVGAQRAA